MSTWEETIGTNQALKSKPVYDKLGQAFYLYMLAARAKKHEANMAVTDDYTTYDEKDPESFPKDPYFQFETLTQVLDPKKPKKKSTKKGDDEEEDEQQEDDDNGEPAYYTYTHAEYKLVKDEETKKTAKGSDGKAVKEVSYGPKKVKKFATIGVDLKRYLGYLLNKFIKEAYDCFISKGKKFAKNTPVLDQLNDYVHANFDQDGLAPFVIAASKLVPIDNFVDEGDLRGATPAFEVAKILATKITPTFKDDKNQKSVTEVETLVDTFLNFVKCIAVLYVEFIWGKAPGPMHIGNVDSVIRQMYVLLNSDERGGFAYQYEIYTMASSWVEEIMKAETDQREDSKKKKEAGGATKSKASKPSGKSSSTKSRSKKRTDDDDDDANGDDVDNQVDELANEEGDDNVNYDE
jgi:hypothetical protein